MEGQEIKAVPPAPRRTGQVVDIFAALKKSLKPPNDRSKSLRFESSEKGRLNDWHRASLRRVRTGSASPSSSHCRMAGAGPSGATGSNRCKLDGYRRANALLKLNRVGHHRVSPALGSGLFARVKVVTRTANIKAASLWRGGNSAAVRALFMIANIRGWSSLTAHEKNLTSGHRVC